MTTQAVHFLLLPRSVFLRCALLLAVCTAVVTASLSALSISSSLNAASERVVDEAWQVTTFVGDQAVFGGRVLAGHTVHAAPQRKIVEDSGG